MAGGDKVGVRLEEIKEMIYERDDEILFDFINDNFRSGSSFINCDYQDNINTLKRIDLDTVNTGLARIESLLESESSYKWVSVFVTLVIALSLSYAEIFKYIDESEIFASIIYFAVVFLIFGITMKVQIGRAHV